ncbi:MAG: hypothetical protein BWY01_01492 [Synergistetes bacterium ADurb.Bin155]|nr:MAG: hypothetical protein BWY01_01492 [Synergistetes bacterium ADurb.Bin155]
MAKSNGIEMRFWYGVTEEYRKEELLSGQVLYPLKRCVTGVFPLDPRKLPLSCLEERQCDVSIIRRPEQKIIREGRRGRTFSATVDHSQRPYALLVGIAKDTDLWQFDRLLSREEAENTVRDIDFWERDALPSLMDAAEKSINDQMREDESSFLAREQKRQKMAAWIEENGSSRLKKCVSLGYPCSAAFAEELVAREYWPWIVAPRGDSHREWQERLSPTEKALDILAKRQKDKRLSDVRIRWQGNREVITATITEWGVRVYHTVEYPV